MVCKLAKQNKKLRISKFYDYFVWQGATRCGRVNSSPCGGRDAASGLADWDLSLTHTHLLIYVYNMSIYVYVFVVANVFAVANMFVVDRTN